MISGALPGRGVLPILSRELTEILRDPRALIAGLVLPLVLYPLLVFGLQSATDSARARIAEQPYRIAVLKNEALLAPVAKSLDKGSVVRIATPLRALGAGAVQVVIDDRTKGELHVYFNGARDDSTTAADKVRGAVSDLKELRRKRALEAAGVTSDPTTLVESVVTDLTSGRSGSQLPLYAPFILILAVLGGASMAALDAIAGERERGTLETLLVHPVSRLDIALGKLLAVVALALISTVANVAALMVMARVVPRVSIEGLGIGTAFLLLVVAVPLSVLLSSLLLAVTSYARSYREAQGYHYPVMVLCCLPGALPLMPGVRLDAVLAWVPVGNVSLAISEILRGVGAPGAHALALLATCVYAALAIGVAVRLLEREEVLSGARAIEDADAAAARKATFFLMLLMVLIYYVGGLVQSRSAIPGLLLTLYGLVLLPAFLYAKLQRLPIRETFSLRPASLDALVAAPILAVALAPMAQLLFRIQSFFLPPPESLEAGFAELLELSPLAKIAFLALSPAICEEVLFRGLLFGLLSRAHGPVWATVVSALTFGAFHLSVYRLGATALVGVALAVVVWRTRSLWPAMVVHACYNGFLGFSGEAAEHAGRAYWGVPASLVLFAVAWRLLRPHPRAVAA